MERIIMTTNLQLQDAMSADRQYVQDTSVTPINSSLAISTDFIGIGTTTPGSKLEIKGNNHQPALIVTNSDSPSAKLFEIADVTNSSSNDATVIKSAEGVMWVIPHFKTSVAIQRAIDYAVSLGSSSTRAGVFLPAGIYNINSPIRIPSYISLVGAGSYATQLLAIDSYTGDIIISNYLPSTTTSYIRIAHLRICAGANSFDARAIYLSGTLHPVIENVVIDGGDSHHCFKVGIHLKAWTGEVIGGSVSDCYTCCDLSWYPVSKHITSVSTGSPAIITSPEHGLRTNDSITIKGTNTVPTINGTQTVTVIDNNTFSIGVNVSTVSYGIGSWNENISEDITNAVCITGASYIGTDVAMYESDIISAIWTSGVITFQTSATHYIDRAKVVKIVGCQSADFDGEYANPKWLDDTHFQVLKTGSGSWLGGGSPKAYGMIIGCFINGVSNILHGCAFEVALNVNSRTPLYTVAIYIKAGLIPERGCHSNTVFGGNFENFRSNFILVSNSSFNAFGMNRTYYNDAGISDSDIVNRGSSGINIFSGNVGKFTWNGSSWVGSDDANRTGTVGIGTTNPSEILGVAGNLRFGNSPLIKWSGNTLGLEGGQGGDMINVVEIRSGQTYGARLDIKGPNNAEMKISLDSGNGAASWFNAGPVGIGITTPTKKLDVNGDIEVRGENWGPGEDAVINLGFGGHNIKAVYGTGVQISTFGAENAMTIKESSGNVGIGVSVTSPAEKLDIDGAICIKDGMTAPSTHTGKASIYVDSADGYLKIKFGDGTVKTIVTD
jgi:hypothetical protein